MSLDGVAYGFCFAVFVDIVVVLTGVLGQHLRHDVGENGYQKPVTVLGPLTEGARFPTATVSLATGKRGTV